MSLLVVWNIFYFSIYWESHHPKWLSYFFRGVALAHQPVMSTYVNYEASEFLWDPILHKWIYVVHAWICASHWQMTRTTAPTAVPSELDQMNPKWPKVTQLCWAPSPQATRKTTKKDKKKKSYRWFIDFQNSRPMILDDIPWTSLKSAGWHQHLWCEDVARREIRFMGMDGRHLIPLGAWGLHIFIFIYIYICIYIYIYI